MKKITTLVFAGMMIFALAACGKKSGEDKQSSTNSQAGTTTSVQNEQTDIQQNNVEVNPVELLFHPATSGNYATIKVDSSVKMDDTSAWLGLCPTGKNYVTELEADEVDVIWFALEPRESEADPYVWACDFESVEDGTYALVVTTSDDENVGYVAIQLTMTKNGDKLTFDFENAQLKERP